MDPDVTIRRLAKKLFTLLWLKHGLIANLPPSGPTSPQMINDISEKIAKAVLVYSYANRPILQFYMEKHSHRIAQSKIAFWNHVSFLCLRIRLRKDDLYDYFLNTCSIMSEVALFCNWKTLDHVHTYASTFFAGFFECELSEFFYQAGGWAGLLNYIDDSCFKELFDMVDPFRKERESPCEVVNIMVYVAAEEFSAERRERIASSRELKVEDIERMEPVRILAAKIFHWDFMEHLHISDLEPGVFRRVGNIRRKSRGNTMAISVPGNSRKLFKGDDQLPQEQDEPVSYMNSTPNLRALEYATPMRDGKSFPRSVSVINRPTTPLQASTSSIQEDNELFRPSIFCDDAPKSSFLETSSWLRPQETKYEHPSFKNVSKGDLNAFFHSSESGGLPVAHVSQTVEKEFTCSKKSLDYNGCAEECKPNIHGCSVIIESNSIYSTNDTSLAEVGGFDSKAKLTDITKPKSEFACNVEVGKEISCKELGNIEVITEPKKLCADKNSHDQTHTECDSASEVTGNFLTGGMTDEFLSNNLIDPNTSFEKKSETICSSYKSLKGRSKEFTEDIGIEFDAEGPNSAVTRNLDLYFDTPETPRNHYQSFEIDRVESVTIKPNDTVHYKKRLFGNLVKREYRVTPAVDNGCVGYLNKNKQTSPNISGARRKQSSNSETTETESPSRKDYSGDDEKITELIKVLKKSGISDL